MTLALTPWHASKGEHCQWFNRHDPLPPHPTTAPCQSGRTVVASIHQPSSRQLRAFHRLLLLCEGRTLFHGPTASALPFFRQLGFVPRFPCNPAEFLLDLATGEVEDVRAPVGLCEGAKWEATPEDEQQTVVKQVGECRGREGWLHWQVELAREGADGVHLLLRLLSNRVSL